MLKEKKQTKSIQENSTNLHHYCILREDLPYGVSHAQLLHAAGESNPGAKHAYAVVLSVPHSKLMNIKEDLSKIGIKHICIYESDLPYDGELTAIGIEPLVKSENKNLRRIVAGLKLLR